MEDQERLRVTTHEHDCDCPAYACQLRSKGVRFSVMATGQTHVNRPFRPKVNSSWEAGKAGERRVDGSFMPYMDGKGRLIPIKEGGERRRELSAIRERQIKGPAPQE